MGDEGSDIIRITSSNDIKTDGGSGRDRIYVGDAIYDSEFYGGDDNDTIVVDPKHWQFKDLGKNNLFDGGAGNDYMLINGQINSKTMGGTGEDKLNIWTGAADAMLGFDLDAGDDNDEINIEFLFDEDHSSSEEMIYGNIHGGKGVDTLSFKKQSEGGNYVYERLFTKKDEYELNLNNFYIIDPDTIGFKSGEQAHEVVKISRDVENIEVTAPDESKINTTFTDLYNVLKGRRGKTPSPSQDI